MGFGALDLAIVLAYLAGVTALGAYFQRQQRDIHDYFLGGRDTPWWALCLSIVATETSALTVIGTPALAYAGDLAFLQVVFGYVVARFLIGFLFLPAYFSGELLTAYQYIRQRFGPATQGLSAALFLVTRALADGVRLFAIALVVQLVLTRALALMTGETLEVAVLWAVLAVMALTLLYTFLGGMKAVIWTDVVQFGVYLAGGLIALFSLAAQIPGGWETVAQQAGNRFAVFDFSFSWERPYTFWAGLFGGTFLTLASHGTDQLLVQRVLAARNLREGRLALIASGFIVLAQFALFLVIGVLLNVFYAPTGRVFATNDQIFPLFMVEQLPAAVSGLMVAGVLAAAMSTSSATLNSLAASTMVDFYQPLAGRADSPELLLRRSRWLTVVWGGVIVMLAMLARWWGPVLVAGLSIASVTYGAMLGLFLLGRLAPGVTAPAAAAGMAAGLGTMLYVSLATPLAWTWYVLLGTLVTFSVGVAASRLWPRKAA